MAYTYNTVQLNTFHIYTNITINKSTSIHFLTNFSVLFYQAYWCCCNINCIHKYRATIFHPYCILQCGIFSSSKKGLSNYNNIFLA